MGLNDVSWQSVTLLFTGFFLKGKTLSRELPSDYPVSEITKGLVRDRFKDVY